MGHRSTEEPRLAPPAWISSWRSARAAALLGCLAIASVSLLGCVGPKETEPLEVATGRSADVSHDGLVRMTGSALEGIWVKPDADVSLYKKLLIGEVRMAYKRKPNSRRHSTTGNNFALTEAQVERLERLFREVFSEQIEASESWALTDAPGPDVLLVEPGLMDLIVRVPTDAPPNATVFTSSTGAVTLVLELRDSLSHEILARVADRREAQRPGTGSSQLHWSNSVSNTAAVRQLFRRWARIFVARLDTAREHQPTEALVDHDETMPPIGIGSSDAGDAGDEVDSDGGSADGESP